MITQAFLNIDVYTPHVANGHYDLVGPDNCRILPQLWGETVQHGWLILMCLWPKPEYPSNILVPWHINPLRSRALSPPRPSTRALPSRYVEGVYHDIPSQEPSGLGMRRSTRTTYRKGIPKEERIVPITKSSRETMSDASNRRREEFFRREDSETPWGTMGVEKDQEKKGGGFFGLFGSKSELGVQDDPQAVKSRKSKKRSSIPDASSLYGDTQFVDNFSRLGSNHEGARSDGARKGSFLDNAGTIGAGVGLAGAVMAIAASCEHQQSETDEHSMEIHFKPSIDPQYGDLLPLPPSKPATPTSEELGEFPSLPESRPHTPEEIYPRSSSTRKYLRETPVKSPSHVAVPISFKLGKGNTSWDSTKEYRPLYLKEGHGSTVNIEEEEQVLPEPASSTAPRRRPIIVDERPLRRRAQSGELVRSTLRPRPVQSFSRENKGVKSVSHAVNEIPRAGIGAGDAAALAQQQSQSEPRMAGSSGEKEREGVPTKPSAVRLEELLDECMPPPRMSPQISEDSWASDSISGESEENNNRSGGASSSSPVTQGPTDITWEEEIRDSTERVDLERRKAAVRDIIRKRPTRDMATRSETDPRLLDVRDSATSGPLWVEDGVYGYSTPMASPLFDEDIDLDLDIDVDREYLSIGELLGRYTNATDTAIGIEECHKVESSGGESSRGW